MNLHYELMNHTETGPTNIVSYLRNNVLNCSCERCQADIMPPVLNSLPARYFVSSRGEIMTQ